MKGKWENNVYMLNILSNDEESLLYKQLILISFFASCDLLHDTFLFSATNTKTKRWIN